MYKSPSSYKLHIRVQSDIKYFRIKKILDKKETHSIDDSVNFGVYRPDNKSAKLVKDKIKNITRIIKELRKTKDG